MTKSLEDVKNMVDGSRDLFSPSYLEEIYDHLTNFCIRRVNIGERKYADHFLNIIDVLIEEKLFLNNGFVSALKYRNCVSIGLLAQRIDWALNFLEKNRSKLQKQLREDAYKFNKAHIFFHQKKYDEAKSLLFGIQPLDMYYKIACDKLLLKLDFYYLMLGEYDEYSFKSRIETAKRFIKSQVKLNHQRKLKSILFLNTLSKLMRNQFVETKGLLGKIPILDYLWIRDIQEKEK